MGGRFAEDVSLPSVTQEDERKGVGGRPTSMEVAARSVQATFVPNFYVK